MDIFEIFDCASSDIIKKKHSKNDLEKEIRHYQKPEILEAMEYFKNAMVLNPQVHVISLYLKR